MKKLLAIVLLFFSVSAFALDTRFPLDGLTEKQKAEVLLRIESLKESAKQGEEQDVVDKTLDRMGKIATMGADIGKGLGAVAKELGIAVNDFSKTPVGMISMGLIVWKVAGGPIVHVVFGGVLWAVFTVLWIWMFRRYYYVTTINETFDKDTQKRLTRKTEIRKRDGADLFSIFSILAAFNAVSLLIAFTGW